MTFTKLSTLLLLSVLWLGCAKKSTNPQSEPSVDQTPAVDGWVSLLDGDLSNHWRNYKSKTLNPQWELKDGVLSLTGKKGGDIISKKQYESFELELDWKISPNGNSGIFFHVVEADSLGKVYHSGPEIQVLDNDGHKDGQIHTHRAGDNYDLQACSVETVKAVGEWNNFKLIVNKGHVEHWLNGTKVVEYQLQSPEWQAQYAKSKFTKWPMYGRAGKGHIALQDHGDEVWYRNIRIKEL
ncbi:MAG: DUF1080 domain-containing protein [Bacteroidota bacterium]